eukprot:g3433.t1
MIHGMEVGALLHPVWQNSELKVNLAAKQLRAVAPEQLQLYTVQIDFARSVYASGAWFNAHPECTLHDAHGHQVVNNSTKLNPGHCDNTNVSIPGSEFPFGVCVTYGFDSECGRKQWVKSITDACELYDLDGVFIDGFQGCTPAEGCNRLLSKTDDATKTAWLQVCSGLAAGNLDPAAQEGRAFSCEGMNPPKSSGGAGFDERRDHHHVVDGPVVGNGNLGVVVGGGAQGWLDFYTATNSFWAMDNGNFTHGHPFRNRLALPATMQIAITRLGLPTQFDGGHYAAEVDFDAAVATVNLTSKTSGAVVSVSLFASPLAPTVWTSVRLLGSSSPVEVVWNTSVSDHFYHSDSNINITFPVEADAMCGPNGEPAVSRASDFKGADASVEATILHRVMLVVWEWEYGAYARSAVALKDGGRVRTALWPLIKGQADFFGCWLQLNSTDGYYHDPFDCTSESRGLCTTAGDSTMTLSMARRALETAVAMATALEETVDESWTAALEKMAPIADGWIYVDGGVPSSASASAVNDNAQTNQGGSGNRSTNHACTYCKSTSHGHHEQTSGDCQIGSLVKGGNTHSIFPVFPADGVGTNSTRNGIDLTAQGLNTILHAGSSGSWSQGNSFTKIFSAAVRVSGNRQSTALLDPAMIYSEWLQMLKASWQPNGVLFNPFSGFECVGGTAYVNYALLQSDPSGFLALLRLPASWTKDAVEVRDSTGKIQQLEWEEAGKAQVWFGWATNAGEVFEIVGTSVDNEGADRK